MICRHESTVTGWLFLCHGHLPPRRFMSSADQTCGMPVGECSTLRSTQGVQIANMTPCHRVERILAIIVEGSFVDLPVESDADPTTHADAMCLVNSILRCRSICDIRGNRIRISRRETVHEVKKVLDTRTMPTFRSQNHSPAFPGRLCIL